MKKVQKFFKVEQLPAEIEKGEIFYKFLKWLKGTENGPIDIRISIDDMIHFLNESRLNLLDKEVLKGRRDHPKVLVIDSEESTISSIGNIFINNGYQVYTAKNGFNAGMLLSSESPQIITLDLNLNILSGLEVLEIINGLKLKDKLWVVIISNEPDCNLDNAILAGADFFLKKPFFKEDLEKIIKKIQ